MNLLATRIQQNRYDCFKLTDAIRPCPDSGFEAVEGYRIGSYRDPETRQRIPMLAVAVSAERVFEVFLDLLAPVGEQVHVVLESSHESIGDYHEDWRRSEIDSAVLASHFCEFEDLLLNDGCLGIAVVAPDRPIEVQFDEHKLLFVYAHDLRPFRRILRSHGIRRIQNLALIAETEHIHYSTPGKADQFNQLCVSIGAGDLDSVFSDEPGWLG